MEPPQINENFFKSLQRASFLTDVGRWREAIQEYNRHLAEFPDTYSAYCNIALCHLELREYQSALDATKKATELDPEEEWAYRLRSTIFMANGEPRRALEAAEMCVEKDPGSPYPVQCLFWAQAHCGALDDAQRSLATLLELMPGSQAAHEAAGYLALKRANYEEAEKHYLEALRIQPESVNALNNLGVVYLQLAQSGKGRHYQKSATEMFERAVKIQPTFKLGQQNIERAANSLKVGAPIGLVFLVYMGFRFVAGAVSGVSESVGPQTSPDFPVNAANLFFVVVFIAAVAAALSCLSPKYRDAVLYQLVTVRGWAVAAVAFGVSVSLYILVFWVLENRPTPFSGAGFGISLVLFIFSLLNLVRVWGDRKK